MGNSFGDFLRQKRQEKNLTQKELSKLLFVSESAVCKWEKGASYPDITLLPKLSKILGVSEHELITASVDNKSREEKIQAPQSRSCRRPAQISAGKGSRQKDGTPLPQIQRST